MGLYRENGNYYNILDNGKGNGNHRDYRVQGDHRGHDASTKSGVKSGEFFRVREGPSKLRTEPSAATGLNFQFKKARGLNAGVSTTVL